MQKKSEHFYGRADDTGYVSYLFYGVFLPPLSHANTFPKVSVLELKLKVLFFQEDSSAWKNCGKFFQMFKLEVCYVFPLEKKNQKFHNH